MLEPGTRGVNAPGGGLFPGGSAAVRDLWAKKDLGSFTGRFETKVGSHDVAMLKVTAKF